MREKIGSISPRSSVSEIQLSYQKLLYDKYGNNHAHRGVKKQEGKREIANQGSLK